MEKLVIKSMNEGNKENGYLLVTKIEEKRTKNGAAYVTFTLCDGADTIEANLWNHAKSDIVVEEKKVIAVELLCKKYQDKLTYELTRYAKPEDDISLTDYIRTAPYSSEAMYNEILSLCNQVSGENAELPRIVEAIYSKFRDKLMTWGAAKTMHHNYHGGLLYHTLRMCRTCFMLSKVYSFDIELLMCSCALHDIGKLFELETDSFGFSDYTTDGELYGHLLIGSEIISDTAKELCISGEKVKLLKHSILSHHGKLEWGAIQVPKTKEAYVLFLIDLLDSHVEQYDEVLKKLEPGNLSERIFGLDCKVYKPDFN